MLEYKGYYGSFKYDEDGDIYTGEIEGIRSVITFQGRTIDVIEGSMKKSIDLYLEACVKMGIQPEAPS